MNLQLGNVALREAACRTADVLGNHQGLYLFRIRPIALSYKTDSVTTFGSQENGNFSVFMGKTNFHVDESVHPFGTFFVRH